MDSDKNGKVEKSEAEKYVKKANGGSMNKHEFGKNFKKVDKNGDGTFSEAELLAGLTSTAEKSGCLKK